MLKFELVQTDKHSTNRFATTEKPPIFQSHKSFKNSISNQKYTCKYKVENDLLLIEGVDNRFKETLKRVK